MQQDKYSRGVPERPIVALVKRMDGRYVELYSTENKDDELVSFNYLRVPQIERNDIGDEMIYVPSVLEDAVVSYVAGLTAISYRYFDLGERLISLSKEMV
jgi:hypothetical protein